MIIAVLLLSTIDTPTADFALSQVRLGRAQTEMESQALTLEEELMPKIEDHLRQSRPDQALQLLDRIPEVAGRDYSRLYFRAHVQLRQWDSAIRDITTRLASMEERSVHFHDVLPSMAAAAAKGDRQLATRMWLKYAADLGGSNRDYYVPQYRGSDVPSGETAFAILYAASKMFTDEPTCSIFLDLALRENPKDARANLDKGFKLIETDSAAAAKHFLVARDNSEGLDAKIAGRNYDRAMKLAKKSSGG